ncbi:MAG: methyltransferase, partial [Flavobacteriales bacterium]
MEFLSDDIHAYISEHTTKAPDFLDDLERETWLKVIMPRMLSGHVQGQILKTLSLMKAPTY